MSYIGVQSQNHVSPAFHREVVTPDGSASVFDLVQDVPGFNADNVLVVVNNVVQHPFDSYTIKADANGNPRRLDFAGTVPASTDVIYVTHRGVGSLNMTPAAGSVDSVALADNLRSGVVNSFTGSQATNSSTQLTYECPSVGSCAINFVHNYNREQYDVCICFEDYKYNETYTFGYLPSNTDVNENEKCSSCRN